MKGFVLRHRRLLLYILYGVLITPVILFVRFPSEVMRDYFQARANSNGLGIQVKIQDASLSFPAVIRLKGIKCSLEKNPEEIVFAAEQVLVRPGVLSLFGKKNRYGFTCQAYGGSVSGRIDLQKNGKDTSFSLSTEFNGIHIDDKSKFPSIIKDCMSGDLKGSLTYSGKELSGLKGTGGASLTISNGSVKFTKPLMNINAIDFKESVIKADLKDQNLDISEIDFRGNDFLGKATGIIALKSPVEKSLINFKGTIEPTASFIKASEKTGGTGLLLRQSLKNGKLPFAFNGTIENFHFRLM